MRAPIALLSLLLALPAIGQKHHEPADRKYTGAQDAQNNTTITVVNPQPAKKYEEKPQSQSSKWPPFQDIYWPNVGLVFLGLAGAIIGIITLANLNRQVRAAINTERAWIAVEFHCTCSQGKDGKWYDAERVPITQRMRCSASTCSTG
jgi:hypothetical protein